MPYVTNGVRMVLRRRLREPVTAGELNFVITDICDRYISEQGLRYQTLNDVIGVLESAKLELYRRIVGPYENTKIEENGEVYSPIRLGEEMPDVAP